jgi:hypothetical protein
MLLLALGFWLLVRCTLAFLRKQKAINHRLAAKPNTPTHYRKVSHMSALPRRPLLNQLVGGSIYSGVQHVAKWVV